MIPSPPFSEIFLGSVRISQYGILIALGFLGAYGVSLFLARRSVLSPHIDRMLFWAVMPAIVCARAVFVFYHLDYFFIHPSEMIAVWQGGWVWHGALVGGFLGVFFYCRKNKVDFLSLLDVCAPGVALGQAIGRWGNFFNQEAYGLPTHAPWGISIDPSHRVLGFEQFSTFHPTFLYESVLDFGLFIFLAWLTIKKIKMPPGAVFFLYLLFYSGARFCIEFFRIDMVPTIADLRAPQWISLGLIGVSIAWFLQRRRKVVYLSS